jgi:hypothetical protein
MNKSNVHYMRQLPSVRPPTIINLEIVTHPGVIEASIEEKIPQVQVRESHLPNFGLIDEIPPGGNVLQGHKVVNVLDRVLETAHIKLSVGGRTM